jgi:hypothetical protein
MTRSSLSSSLSPVTEPHSQTKPSVRCGLPSASYTKLQSGADLNRGGDRSPVVICPELFSSTLIGSVGPSEVVQFASDPVYSVLRDGQAGLSAASQENRAGLSRKMLSATELRMEQRSSNEMPVLLPYELNEFLGSDRPVGRTLEPSRRTAFKASFVKIRGAQQRVPRKAVCSFPSHDPNLRCSGFRSRPSNTLSIPMSQGSKPE